MKRGFNQGKLENAERARTAEVEKRSQRTRETISEGSKIALIRNQLLEQFKLKDVVTDGRFQGTVTKLDTLRGEVVFRLRSGKEMRCAPQFVQKV